MNEPENEPDLKDEGVQISMDADLVLDFLDRISSDPDVLITTLCVALGRACSFSGVDSSEYIDFIKEIQKDTDEMIDEDSKGMNN